MRSGGWPRSSRTASRPASSPTRCSRASRPRSGTPSGCGGKRSPARRCRRSMASEEPRGPVSIAMPRMLGYAEPIRPTPARQVIMGTWAQDRSAGFALMLDETGALACLHGGTLVSTRVPLTARRWYHVGASVDLAAATMTVLQTPLAEHAPSLEAPVAVTAALTGTAAPPADFFIGAAR